jgi:integrase
MALAYNVAVIHLKDGGRLPLLFHEGSPFPVSLVCRYVVQMLWPRGLKTNTILSEVRSLAELYEWAAGLTPPLDLELALRNQTLDTPQLLSFANWAKGRPKRTKSGVIQLTEHGTPAVRMGLNSNKVIRSVRDFLCWAANHQAKMPKDDVESIKKGLEATLVIGKRGGLRRGFTAEQKAELMRCVEPNSSDNPFNEPVRKRNYTIIKLLLETGIRRGELLCLQVRDVHVGGSGEPRISVRARNTASADPRDIRPEVKTRERDILLRSDTKALIIDLLTERLQLKAKGIIIKHPFLVIAPSTGRPLTLDGVNSIFRRISKVRPSLGWAHPHKLRHTFNDDFLARGTAGGDDVTSHAFDAMHKHISGWSPNSKMRARYTVREMEQQAGEILRKHQGT